MDAESIRALGIYFFIPILMAVLGVVFLYFIYKVGTE